MYALSRATRGTSLQGSVMRCLHELILNVFIPFFAVYQEMMGRK